MSDEKRVERVWVGIVQGAQMTGYTRQDISQIAHTLWEQPENERPIKMRYQAKKYEFWLPDLVRYLENTKGAQKDPTIERIWVGINEGAEISGARREYLRQLAASTLEQPVEGRPLKVRFRSNRYEFWLPDLIPYIQNSDDPSAHSKQNPNVEPIWVTTTEAMEITGYNFGHLKRLALKMWRQPEAERAIHIRSRSHRYELWLPDLVAYIENIGHGPHQTSKKK